MYNVLISYDLVGEPRDYQSVYRTIKSAPAYQWLGHSVWELQSEEPPKVWEERLGAIMKPQDRLLVTLIESPVSDGLIQ